MYGNIKKKKAIYCVCGQEDGRYVNSQAFFCWVFFGVILRKRRKRNVWKFQLVNVI